MTGGRGAWRHVLAIAGLGIVLLAAMLAFVCLYLSVPSGWSPLTGFNPDIVPVFRRVFRYPTLALDPGGFTRAALVLLAAMWATFGGALALLARVPAGARRTCAVGVAAASVLFHAALVPLPPVLSADLYHYALFGRMVAVHGLNPYVTHGNALAGDPLLRFANWTFLSTHYGPVFTLLSALCARIGGGGVIATAFAFKITAAAFDLGCGWAIYRLARVVGGTDGLIALAVYAWNPLPIIESAVSGHNEPVMMALCLAGLLWSAQGRVMAGWAALMFSVMVKYVSASVALLVAARVVAMEPTGRRRAARAALLLLAAAALLAAFYAPFWRGVAGFRATIDLVLKGRAIRSARAAQGAGPSMLIAYGVLLAAAAFLAWRGSWSWVLALSAALSLLFVLVFPWMLPWYFIPAIALAAGAPRTATNHAVLITSCAAGLLTMLAYAKLVPIAP